MLQYTTKLVLALALITSIVVAETPDKAQVEKSFNNVEAKNILPETEADDLEADASHWRAYRAYPHWGGAQNYYGGGWNRPGFYGGGGWGGNQGYGWGRPQYGGYGHHGQGFGYGGHGGYQGGYWG